MQTFMQHCMTFICALTTVVMLVACSKWGSGNDLYFHVTGNVSNCESVFPSTYVLMVVWLTVGCLMLVG